MLAGNAGRMVADLDEGFVVYINGMRLNKLRALPQYLAAGLKAGKMLDRLAADPDSGFLGYEPAVMGLRQGAAIQYWRSLEDLKRFANDPEGTHVPAWQWYNRSVSPGGGVGFWAELYVVEPDTCETFFRNMRPAGVGKVAGIVPAGDRARRLGLSPDGETVGVTVGMDADGGEDAEVGTEGDGEARHPGSA